MSAREPQPLLHNMSAPPRARIVFRAVRPAGLPADQGETAACGLRWHARFDACGLLAPPFEPGTLPDLAEPAHERNARRLRFGLARARAEAVGASLPESVPPTIAALPLETVADALRTVAADVRLADAGLPAFGLLLPASGEVRTCVCAVRLTIAVLARCRGTVFLRDAEPLAPAWLDGPMLDLWEPVPLAGGEGPCATR